MPPRGVDKESPVTLRSGEFFLMDSGSGHQPEVSAPIMVPRTSMAWLGTGIATVLGAIAVLILVLERNEYLENTRKFEVRVAELEAIVKEQEGKLGAADKAKADAAADKVKLEEAEKAAAKALVDRISGAVPDEVAKGDVRIAAESIPGGGSRVKIELGDALMFGNESIVLTPEGTETLKRLAAVLSKIERHRFDVVGHTDNRRTKRGADVPPSSPDASLWGLSVARATVVGRVLEEEGRVAAAKLTISGRAAAQPLGSNSNNKGKQRNRRTEIILTPFPPAPTDAAPAPAK